MFILKHVEHVIEDDEELERLRGHLLDTTSNVDGVELIDILFPRGKDEFVLLMDCVSEKSYLEWRDICPPPKGAKDWYEVWLSRNERYG
jgi:hypothetical protein